MSQPPTISVLMPVYNAESYVAEAVESVLSQSFADFEFLIINDGSRDRSRSILQAYADQDPRIRLISRENRGLIASLNELVAQARGEFLARMDADDICLSNRFSQQVAFLQAHPEVLCVGGAYDMIDAQGKLITLVKPPEQDAEIQEQMLSGGTAIQHPCAMVRRRALLQVRGYDRKTFLAEDLDLWLRLGEMGQLANLPDPVLRYRVHDQSLSARRIKRQSKVVQRVCQQAWKRRGLPKRACKDAVVRHHQHMLECGWRSFNQGQRQAAIRYGIKAVDMLPFNLESWRLLVCAVIKPLPQVAPHE